LGNPLPERGRSEATLETEGNVRRNGAPLQQGPRIILEDDDDPLGRTGDGVTMKADAAIAGGRQPSEKAKQRGLSCARSADDRQKLAAEDIESNGFQNRPVAAGKVDAIIEITAFED